MTTPPLSLLFLLFLVLNTPHAHSRETRFRNAEVADNHAVAEAKFESESSTNAVPHLPKNSNNDCRNGGSTSNHDPMQRSGGGLNAAVAASDNDVDVAAGAKFDNSTATVQRLLNNSINNDGHNSGRRSNLDQMQQSAGGLFNGNSSNAYGFAGEASPGPDEYYNDRG